MKPIVLFICIVIQTSITAQLSFSALKASSYCPDTSCFSKYARNEKFSFDKILNVKNNTIPVYQYKSFQAAESGPIIEYYLGFSTIKNPGLLSVQIIFTTSILDTIGKIMDELKAEGFSATSTSMPLIFTSNRESSLKVYYFIEAKKKGKERYYEYSIALVRIIQLNDESNQFYGDVIYGESIRTGFFARDAMKLGIQKFTNGDVFKGAYYGIMQYADKKRLFYGTFRQENYSSKEGIMKKQNGDLYFINDHATKDTVSYGPYWSRTGDLFYGYITFDGRRVSGMQRKSNGEMYNGQFRDSLYDGTGTLYYPDGKMMLAVFRKGIPVGKGVIYYPDGTSEIKQFGPGTEAVNASDTSTFKYRYFKNSSGSFWGQASLNWQSNTIVPNGCGVFKRGENGPLIFTGSCTFQNNNPDYFRISHFIYKDPEGNIGYSYIDKMPSFGNLADHYAKDAEFLKLKSGNIHFKGGDISLYKDRRIFVGTGGLIGSPIGTMIWKNGKMYSGSKFGQQEKAIEIDLAKKEAYEGGFSVHLRHGNGFLYKPGQPPKAVKYNLGVLIK